MSESALPPRTIREVAARGYAPDVRTVGTTVLRQRLSEYLRLVVSGETILVTDRDRVVAELRPPSPAHPQLADALLAAMVVRGSLTLPTVIGGGPPPRLPVPNADEILESLAASRANR